MFAPLVFPASARLRRQGFVNAHRKPLLLALAAGALAWLHFIPAAWSPPPLAGAVCGWTGALLVFAGILGRTLATLTIGGHKDAKLVRTELYSVCRNPLYFASFLIVLGLGFLSRRPDFLLLASGGYLAVFFPMMRNEADSLRAHFPDFAAYEAAVPLFFPDFRLWRERPSWEIHFRLVKRTLLVSLLALLAVPLIAAAAHHRPPAAAPATAAVVRWVAAEP